MNLVLISSFLLLSTISTINAESDIVKAFFTQPLDHFNSDNNQTWEQVYFSNDEFYADNGPIFLHINAPSLFLDPIPIENILTSSRVHQLAEETSGRIISLQARYFNESQPVP